MKKLIMEALNHIKYPYEKCLEAILDFKLSPVFIGEHTEERIFFSVQ